MKTRILVCMALLLASSSAFAQGDDGKRAVKKGGIGVALYEEGKWQQAFDQFDEAEALFHSPVFLLYAARCKRNLGALQQAAALYRKLTDEPLGTKVPQPWRQAQIDGNAELAALESDLERQRLHEAQLEEAEAERLAAEEAARKAEMQAETRPVQPAPPPPKDDDRLGIVLTIAGGALLVGGGVVGALALSKASTAKARLTDDLGCSSNNVCPAGEKSAVEAATDPAVTLGTASMALLIGGALVTTVGIVLWADGDENETGVSLGLAPTRGSLKVRF